MDRLSIGIGDRRIYFVVGCFKGEKLCIKKHSCICINEGLVTNGVVVDVKALAQIIREHMKVNGYRQKAVRFTVDTSLYMMKEITLPELKNRGDTVSMLRHYLEGIMNIKTAKCRVAYRMHRNVKSGYADYEVYLISDKVIELCEGLAEALKMKLISVNVPKVATRSDEFSNAFIKVTEKAVFLSVIYGKVCKFSKTWYGRQTDLWLMEACKYIRLYVEDNDVGELQIYVYGDDKCDIAVNIVNNVMNSPIEKLSFLQSDDWNTYGMDEGDICKCADVITALLENKETIGFQRKEKDVNNIAKSLAIWCAIMVAVFLLVRAGIDLTEVRSLQTAASEKYEYITDLNHRDAVSRAQEINREIANLQSEMQIYHHMLKIAENDCMNEFDTVEIAEKLKSPDTKIIGITVNESGATIRLRSKSGEDAGYMLKNMRKNGIQAHVTSIEIDRADKDSYVYDIVCPYGGESHEQS